MRMLLVPAVLLTLTLAAAAGAADRPLDGGGNNVAHPNWGKAGVRYIRVAPTNYVDRIGSMIDSCPAPPTPPPATPCLPNARWISNRIFQDNSQNLFSESNLSQLDWVWGQFMDHTFGLRDERPAEDASIAFNSKTVDALENFNNDSGFMPFNRTPAAPGTGTDSLNPRQQINTESSYIDATNIYGDTLSREEWLRDGLFDGDMSNNDAQLVLINNYLPRGDARGDGVAPPPMDLMGPLTGNPNEAVVSGDVRANENIALTAMHTLFAREHNRIASMVPQSLSEEQRFQVARHVVAAEEQFITYTEFLPAMGINLPAYAGYDTTVNAGLSNEFATVGYRAHSQIHGEMEPVAPATRYSATQLDRFRNQGITVEFEGSDVVLVIPLGVTFGNPDLLQQVGLGPLFKGLANERQYKNDEQIDNQLRSILFQIPKPGTNPADCVEGPNPACFSQVMDLGAIDIQRERDHGMPMYNRMRQAYGLLPKLSFIDITGEASAPVVDPNDPTQLDFLQLFDEDGNAVPLGDANNAVTGIRKTTLASRLKEVYGSVSRIDAFVGMMCEQHVPGTEFGELQLAMWTKQFQALRDGDRFFYLNPPEQALLNHYRDDWGIDYQNTLADIINMNTNAHIQADAFHAAD